MNPNYQDRIDDYLLGRMPEQDRALFEKDLKQDAALMEQFVFTQNVRSAIASRAEKLQELYRMKAIYESKHGHSRKATGSDGIYCAEPDINFSPCCNKTEEQPVKNITVSRRLMYFAAIAAVFVIGLFAIGPELFNDSEPVETFRGVDGNIFEPGVLNAIDTLVIMDKDTLSLDSLKVVQDTLKDSF